MQSLIVSAFGLPVELRYQTPSSPISDQIILQCEKNQFLLSIPDVARFIAQPADNCIIIEKAIPNIQNSWIDSWLYGTVFAYVLQYHGYLVLHGSAVLINDQAVIFSGQSGAGKSTLASSLVRKNYLFITDDLIVIKQNNAGQYCVLPGPTQLKLWKDAIQHFNYDMNNAEPVMLKTDKYIIPVEKSCNKPMIPISAFYELNISEQIDTFNGLNLSKLQSLKTLMQNAYRYFMLKPLDRLQTFFHDCSGLSQQINVYKIFRTYDFSELAKIINYIELCQRGA